MTSPLTIDMSFGSSSLESRRNWEGLRIGRIFRATYRKSRIKESSQFWSRDLTVDRRCQIGLKDLLHDYFDYFRFEGHPILWRSSNIFRLWDHSTIMIFLRSVDQSAVESPSCEIESNIYPDISSGPGDSVRFRYQYFDYFTFEGSCRSLSSVKYLESVDSGWY
jgi:hypothetical protein